MDGAVHADQFTPPGGVLLRKQAGHRNVVYEARIADILVPIGERQLQRLRQHVQIIRGVVPQCFQIEAFYDVQRYQQHDALRIGSALVDIVALIRRVNGIGLLGLKARQVFITQHTAGLPVSIRCHPRKRPAIEDVRAIMRDRIQSTAQVRLDKQISKLRRLASGKQDALGTGVLREELKRFHVIRSGPFAQDMSFRGSLDCRRILLRLPVRTRHTAHSLGSRPACGRFRASPVSARDPCH